MKIVAQNKILLGDERPFIFGQLVEGQFFAQALFETVGNRTFEVGEVSVFIDVDDGQNDNFLQGANRRPTNGKAKY